MSTRFSVSMHMFILLISLLGATPPKCGIYFEIQCGYKGKIAPVIRCSSTNIHDCDRLRLDPTYKSGSFNGICEDRDIRDMDAVQENCFRRSDPTFTFKINIDHWQQYLTTKKPRPSPHPECSKALAIHCADFIFHEGPYALCRAVGDEGAAGDVFKKCYTKLELKSVIFKEKYQAWICRTSSSQLEEGLLDKLRIIGTKCTDPSVIFEIPREEWIAYLKEIYKMEVKKLKEEEKERKIRAKYGVHSVPWWSSKFKSVQGREGDCVMHSLNNILGGPYLTNYVMGFTFGERNGLKLIKVPKGTSQEIINEAWATATYDFMSVYDGKTEKHLYYEEFGDRVVNKALALFNAEEKKLKVEVYWYAVFVLTPKELGAALKTVRTDPTTELLGLRFEYALSVNERHSIGIRFRKEDTTKPWLFVQSWEGVKPLELTDFELASHLSAVPIFDKGVEWKGQYWIYVVTVKEGAKLLPAPHRKIYENDEALDAYYHCLQNHVEELIDIKRQSQWIKKCQSKVIKIGRAMTNYKNYFYYDYDDDMDISYDDELEEMREINRLKQLIDREEYQVNGLLREHYSRKNRLDSDDSIEDNYY